MHCEHFPHMLDRASSENRAAESGTGCEANQVNAALNRLQCMIWGFALREAVLA